MSQFILSGFADEIAPELDTQIRVMKSLEISYIEMRGVNGKNLCEHSLAQAQEIKAQLDIPTRSTARPWPPNGTSTAITKRSKPT